MYQRYRTHKYNATRASFNGKVYDSALERNNAMWLHVLVKEGKVAKVEEQKRLDCYVNGKLVCYTKVDFKITLLDGRVKWVEIKGFPTDVWRLKKKLIDALYDNYLVNPTEAQILA